MRDSPAVRWHFVAQWRIYGVSFPPRHRRRFSPVETGGFLLRKGGGGAQGRPSIRRRRRRFTVQQLVQRCGGNAPSAADAAAKARDGAAPPRRGLRGYTEDRRGFPRGKIGSFKHFMHRKMRRWPRGGRHFIVRQRVLSPCVNARPCASSPSEIPPPGRTHRLGLRIGSLHPLAGG